MIRARRLYAVALALLVVTGMLVPALAAGAATSDDLEVARRKVADARAAANETAAAFSEADHQLQETRDEIGRLRDSITATKARAAELRDQARERALFAYTHPSSSLEALVDAKGTVEAARRHQLLERANQTDSDASEKLATVNDRLKDQQGQLEQREREQAQISTQLDAKLTALQANQREVEQAVVELQAKLDAELALSAFLDAAHKAQLVAEKAALATQQVISSGGAGQILASPVTGAFQCPVQGAAYSDDYGGARGHGGIDMFVPTGSAAVAVTAGSVSYVANEGAGGNTAYLSGADGNTYFYAHFSEFVGGARSVSQGEVIGLTGMTGNASAPHLHFEIRLGGPNGNKTDPYPSLRGAGC